MNIRSCLNEQHHTLPFSQDFTNITKFKKNEVMAFKIFFPYEKSGFTYARLKNLTLPQYHKESCTMLIIDCSLILYIYLHQ